MTKFTEILCRKIWKTYFALKIYCRGHNFCGNCMENEVALECELNERSCEMDVFPENFLNKDKLNETICKLFWNLTIIFVRFYFNDIVNYYIQSYSKKTLYFNSLRVISTAVKFILKMSKCTGNFNEEIYFLCLKEVLANNGLEI